MGDWALRFLKGIIIGAGFILPGVSGGALAAVFGVYGRIISFLAHITRDFREKALYLVPLALGGAVGVILFSFAVSYLLGTYEVQILWLFIGCILGTVPALWSQAGKKGRQGRHTAILALSFVLGLLFMLYGEKLFGGGLPQNTATWTLAGALVGLGMIVPGLSPSNFLIFMGMYRDMTQGIGALNMGIIIPVALGALLAVLPLSKVMDFTLKKAYAGMHHGILGIVLASTLMIVPRNYNYLRPGALLCLALCAAGFGLGHWMCSVEREGDVR